MDTNEKLIDDSADDRSEMRAHDRNPEVVVVMHPYPDGR